MRVLLAGGDEAFLEVAQRYLSRHGHEVKIATNGLESVAVLRRYVPDVVVLERELLWGGSDGVRALMKQEPRWSKIPVILTSDNLLSDESNPTAVPSLAAQRQRPYCLEGLLGHLHGVQCGQHSNPALTVENGGSQ